LQRQERTAYRKKLHKKFKDREVGRGTQGAAAAGTSANMFVHNYDFRNALKCLNFSDYSTKPSGTSAEPSPHASPRPTEGPRQQRPAQQAKKNKKKKGGGGKW
jgi:hypothetical protein